LRERCGKIALRVSIDRRRRWASFHRNPFVKKRKSQKTGRSKKELVSLPLLPEFASLSPCRSVAGFKSLIRLELVGEEKKTKIDRTSIPTLFIRIHILSSVIELFVTCCIDRNHGRRS
jgi:hypothetical protein